MKKTLLFILATLSLFTNVASFAAIEKNPKTIVFSFQKQKDPSTLKASAEKMAEELTKLIGIKVEIYIPQSYGSTVQGLISNKVHVAYMDSLPFILASNETPLEILAVEKRKGRLDYDSLLVVKKDSPIQSLDDLKGKKIAFTSQTSTSGYLFPFYRLLSDKKIETPEKLDGFFTEKHFAGGYDKALQSVARGQTDVAAFSDYVIEGPKADIYGTKETRDQIRVLARTSGVPTHLVAVNSSLSKELKTKIQDALLKISKDQPDLLAFVYGATELTQPKGDHVAKTKEALKKTGLDVKNFVQ